MTEIRRHERFYIQDPDQFIVQVEPNEGRVVNCFLNDISISGACIILDKQVFLQREKEYPFQILQKQPNGELENFANTKGKIVWYLPKEFQGQDMLYLGIEFREIISLPQNITSHVKGSY
jgi:hypothetical protein